MSIEKVKEIIENSNNIVFFGGAGVSTASGIPDFRSATGLYNKKTKSDYSPEYMLSHEFITEHPEDFSKYYKEELIFPNAKPNKAHIALYELEKRKKLKSIITQNIDGLHQDAGCKNVYEIHGNLIDHYCIKCGKNFDLEYALKSKGSVFCESCGGFVRPDVVLYGEQLKEDVISAAINSIVNSDVLIVAGTSLVVYPAAGFLQYYKGNKLIIINNEATQNDGIADYVIHDDLTKVMEYITKEI